MRYACLVYLDGTKLDALTDPERVRLRRESAACEDDLRRSGHFVAAAPLHSVRAATTVRVREGRPITVDGPVTEAAGELDSVLVLEARDLNEAIRLAARMPAGRLGEIEIRPIRARPRNAETEAGVVGASDPK